LHNKSDKDVAKYVCLSQDMPRIAHTCEVCKLVKHSVEVISLTLDRPNQLAEHTGRQAGSCEGRI